MENASKALLIAAAVLIAILIITVGIKIFNSSSDTATVAKDTGKTINDKTKDATDSAVSAITGKRPVNPNIKYFEKQTNNQKTQENVVPGDTIKIDTEKFMIFSKTSSEIKAMPWYNIELKTDNPKQKRHCGSTAFSSEVYWPKGTDKINMSDNRNGIQKYILAYKNTLEKMGVGGIDVRIARYSEVENLANNKEMLNPGDDLYYWLGSAEIDDDNDVKIVRGDGVLMSITYSYPSYVRPIIIIPI